MPLYRRLTEHEAMSLNEQAAASWQEEVNAVASGVSFGVVLAADSAPEAAKLYHGVLHRLEKASKMSGVQWRFWFSLSRLGLDVTLARKGHANGKWLPVPETLVSALTGITVRTRK